jgi:hypothetical protein
LVLPKSKCGIDVSKYCNSSNFPLEASFGCNFARELYPVHELNRANYAGQKGVGRIVGVTIFPKTGNLCGEVLYTKMTDVR